MKARQKELVFKVLTLNIHKGVSAGNRKETLATVKANIRDTGADIVCLQEVLGAHSDGAAKPQFEFLADQIWSHYAYGKNAIYSKGHHGNAILSHYPFTAHENLDISNHNLEKRGVLHGVVECPDFKGEPLHVMTVHLDLSGWGRERQLRKICRMIAERVPRSEPLVLCGDFNDWREKATALLAETGLIEAHAAIKGSHARTFPAVLPFLKLDRIYVRGLEIREVYRLAHGPWRMLSDHVALAADLVWSSKSPC